MPADPLRELEKLVESKRAIGPSPIATRWHRARVEWALERDLGRHPEIRPAERGALHAQARAVDVAEALADSHLITEANRGFLELRTAAGLSAATTKPPDAFDALAAELARPGAAADW